MTIFRQAISIQAHVSMSYAYVSDNNDDDEANKFLPTSSYIVSW